LSFAAQAQTPAHPNPHAESTSYVVTRQTPAAPRPLKRRLGEMADGRHTYLDAGTCRADGASQLFQYYLLDSKGCEPTS